MSAPIERSGNHSPQITGDSPTILFEQSPESSSEEPPYSSNRPIPTTVTDIFHEIKLTSSVDRAQELYQPLFDLLPAFTTQNFADLVGIVLTPKSEEESSEEEFTGSISHLLNHSLSLVFEQQQLAQKLGEWILEHPVDLVGPKKILKEYIQKRMTVISAFPLNSPKRDRNFLASFLAIQAVNTYFKSSLIEDSTFYNHLCSRKDDSIIACKEAIGTALDHLPKFISKETGGVAEFIPHKQPAVIDQILNWWIEHSPEKQMQMQIQTRYLKPMMYFAKAIHIQSESNRLDRSIHEPASKLFSQLVKEYLILNPDFKRKLQLVLNSGEDSLRQLEKRLADIETLSSLCLRSEIDTIYNMMKDLVTNKPPSFNRMIEQSHTKTKTLQSKYPTERYREALNTFRQSFQGITQDSSVDDVLRFQEKQMEAFQTFLNVLLKDAFAVIGAPPCHYEIRGMGSCSRSELCPFSDLEPFILIEDKKHKDYFELLLQILELQIYSLGETTSIDTPVFTCLGKKHKSGFHLDKSPDGWVFTPQELANLQNTLDFSEDVSSFLHMAFSSYCVDSSYERFDLGTPQTLFKTYRQQLNHIVTQERSLHYLSERLKDFESEDCWKIPFSDGLVTFDLKAHFVQPLNYLLNDLALYFGIPETNTLKLIELFQLERRFTIESARLLKEAVAHIYAIRIRVHLDNKAQKETISRNQLTPNEITALTRCYHLVLLPLYSIVRQIHNKAPTVSYYWESCWESLDEISSHIQKAIKESHPEVLPQLYKELQNSLDNEMSPENPDYFWKEFIETPKEALKQSLLAKDTSKVSKDLTKLLQASALLERTRIHEKIALPSFFRNTDLVEVASKAYQPNYESWAQSIDTSDKTSLENLLANPQNYLESLNRKHLEPIAEHLSLQPLDESGLRLSTIGEIQQLRNQIYSITTTTPSKVSIRSAFFDHVRYLKAEAIDKILDKNGHIRNSHPGSAHYVSSYQNLYFKEKPCHPLMEYAVYDLSSRIAGSLTPATELVRFEVDGIPGPIPVLISKAKGNYSLEDALSKNIPIDIKQWTWLLICAILTRPGDGRFSNYVVDRDGKVFGIDNDISFVEPVTKKFLSFTPEVNLFSKLFLLFHATAPLDKEVLQAFVNLRIEKVLIDWIDGVIAKEKEYLSLFSEKEREQLYNEDSERSFTPKILFAQGALATLCMQFWTLQGKCQQALEQEQELVPLDLLNELISLRDPLDTESHVGKIVHAYYKRTAFSQSAKERVKPLDARNNGQSLSWSQASTTIFQRLPTHDEIEANLLSPENAKKEFGSLLRVASHYIDVALENGQRSIKSTFSKITHDKQPDTERQVMVLRGLALHVQRQKDKATSINLSHCAVLNSFFLKQFLHPDLEILDISFCPQITENDVSTIAKMCPNLKKLNISGCSKLERLGARTVFIGNLNVKVKFPSLEELEINDCASLELVMIRAEKLFSVEAKRCTELKYIELNTSPYNFGIVNCQGSPIVKFEHNLDTKKMGTPNKHYYLFGALVKYQDQIHFDSPNISLKSIKLIPRNMASHVSALNFQNTCFPVTEIEQLVNACPNLTQLDLKGTRIPLDNTLKLIQSCHLLDHILIDSNTISALTLQEYGLAWCYALINKEELKRKNDLEKLTTLDLDGCKSLITLNLPGDLSALTKLDLNGCKGIKELNPLATLTKLQMLSLIGCKGIKELNPLATLTKLQMLSLALCEEIKELNSIATLTNLQRLSLALCEGIKELTPLATLTNLQSLNLSGCKEIKELNPLAMLTKLQWLDLSGCKETKELNPLATLTKLQWLDLSGCKGIKEKISFIKRALPNCKVITH